MSIQHQLENVSGGKKGIHHFALQQQFALADAVKQVFQDMGDILQIGEAKRAARSLDRMGGAENRVELLRVRILQIEFEQQGLHAGQMLLGFLEEDLVELTDVKAHDWLPKRVFSR